MLAMRERSSVAVVTDDVGQRIRARRTRLGMAVKALAERAGVDRGRLAEIEAGTATNVRPATLGAIYAALDDLERERGADADLPPGAHHIGDPGDDLVEFTIEGTDGMRAVVKGPIRNMDELQAAARKLIEGLQIHASKDDDA
jgi:transcriptional regulator with XRE-family HTH domain